MSGAQPLTRPAGPHGTRRFILVTLALTGLVGLLSACDSGGSPAPATSPALSTVTATPVRFGPPASPAPLMTPRARQLTLDIPLETSYIPGQPSARYLFASESAGRIAIQLDATDGGPALRLQARLLVADGSLVPHVDASLGGPLLLDEWDLPAPGDYQIEIFGPEDGPRAFALTVTRRPLPTPGGSDLRYGQTRSGMIDLPGQRDVWTFVGESGDWVRITMVAAPADGYLALYGPAGDVLGRDDDAPGMGRNPVLDVTLPAGGTYTILAYMYGDEQTGTYQITLERLEPDASGE